MWPQPLRATLSRGTAVEVAQIAGGQALLGAEPPGGSAHRRRHRYLHIAAHGGFSRVAPLQRHVDLVGGRLSAWICSNQHR
ncbi:MAG: hypothetical protein R2856_14090 [Caldilineaceae bacterium]